MRLSALDIRKHEFARGFRGYDQDEVDAFLHMLAQQWQELADENRRLQDRLEEQVGKLSHYMKVEEALEEALETAREGARTRLENADRQAEATTTSAERKAEASLAEAEAKVAKLVGEAELRSNRIIHAAEDERREARHDVTHIAMRRVELIARLRSFLSTELEVLARYESQEAKSDADFETRLPAIAPVQAPEVASDESGDVAPEPHDETSIEEKSSAEIQETDAAAEPETAEDLDALPAAHDIEGEMPSRNDDFAPESNGGGAVAAAESTIVLGGGRQGELMDEESGDTTDEIKRIRRILEDLDS